MIAATCLLTTFTPACFSTRDDLITAEIVALLIFLVIAAVKRVRACSWYRGLMAPGGHDPNCPIRERGGR